MGENRGRNKLYVSATFVRHLALAGRINVNKTHPVFKVGIGCLHVSLILYLVAFISPHWVQGESHAYKNDESDEEMIVYIDDSAGLNSSLRVDRNGSHFGLWEDCTVVDGESVCTIFAEDIDSVILMFGCVNGFILAGLCCWSCLSCLRKSKKSRYIVIVIAAIIGGIFGFVSIFIFIGVQGQKPYSWAFALFLASCVLELSTAPIFLWGIRLATADGSFTCRQWLEMANRERGRQQQGVPGFTVTGPTPVTTGTPRFLQAVPTPSIPRIYFRPHEGTRGPQSDFVTLDMVSPVPDKPLNGRRKCRQKRRKKLRKAVSDCQEKDGMEHHSINMLARQALDQHMGYINVTDSAFIDAGPKGTQPNLFITDADKISVFAKSQSASGLDRHEPLVSAYIDLQADSSQTPSIWGHLKELQKHHSTTSNVESRHFQGFHTSSQHPFQGSSRQSLPHRTSGSLDIHLTVDIHQPLNSGRSQTFNSLANAPVTGIGVQRSERQEQRVVTTDTASPFQSFVPDCKDGFSSPEEDADPDASLLTPDVRHTLGNTPTKSFRCPGRVKEKESADGFQYVEYSPDTYYRARSSFHSFKPDDKVIQDTYYRFRSSFHSFKPSRDGT